MFMRRQQERICRQWLHMQNSNTFRHHTNTFCCQTNTFRRQTITFHSYTDTYTHRNIHPPRQLCLFETMQLKEDEFYVRVHELSITSYPQFNYVHFDQDNKTTHTWKYLHGLLAQCNDLGKKMLRFVSFVAFTQRLCLLMFTLRCRRCRIQV